MSDWKPFEFEWIAFYMGSNGKWSKVKPDKGRGEVGIWSDGNKLHLRTIASIKRCLFTGHTTSDGEKIFDGEWLYCCIVEPAIGEGLGVIEVEDEFTGIVFFNRAEGRWDVTRNDGLSCFSLADSIQSDGTKHIKTPDGKENMHILPHPEGK